MKTAQRQEDEMRTEIREGVRDDVRDGVRDDIRDDMRDEVREEVRDQIKVEAEAINDRELEPFRNDDMLDSEFLRNDDKKTEINEDDKDHRDKMQRQFSWLTIENDDGVGVDI